LLTLAAAVVVTVITGPERLSRSEPKQVQIDTLHETPGLHIAAPAELADAKALTESLLQDPNP